MIEQQHKRLKISAGDVALIAALTLTAFIVIGCTLGSFSLLIDPMRAELGWNAEQASRLPSSFLFSGAIAAVVTGWLVDRIGPRTTMMAAAVTLGGGLLIASRCSGMPLLITAFVLAGTGYTAVTLASTYVAARKLPFGVGVTLGLIMFGMGAGSAVVPIFLDMIISRFGWRGGLAANGIATAAVILLVALTLIPRRSAFAASEEELGHNLAKGPEPRFPMIPFSLLMSAELLFGIAVMAVFIHAIPFLTQRGLSSGTAVMMFGAFNMVGAIGPIVIGWLADRFGPPRFVIAAMVMHGFVLWTVHWLSSSTPTSMLVLFCLLWGLSSSTVTPMGSMMVRRIVPAPALGRCLGIEAFVTGSAGAVGPTLMGIFADSAMGYRLGLMVMAALSVAAIVPFIALLASTMRARSDANRLAALA